MKISKKRKALIVLLCTLSISLTIILRCYPQRISRGRSMEPTIYNWSLLVLDKQITEESLTGEIIAFKPAWSEEVIVHRVIADYNWTLITKGDNNNYPDEPIYREDIEGVVINYYSFGWILFVERFVIIYSVICVVFVLFWESICSLTIRINYGEKEK